MAIATSIAITAKLLPIAGQSDLFVITVTDSYGNQLVYEANSPEFMAGATLDATLQVNGELNFTYAYRKDGLTVTYPDATVREYRYDRDGYLSVLKDERGIDYAKWQYDSFGRAIISEHAGGVDKISLQYHGDLNSPSTQTTETNELGLKTRYTSQQINGFYRLVREDREGSQSVKGASQTYAYDNDGRRTHKTDWEGEITTYAYNKRGLLSEVVRAVGTDDESRMTQKWLANRPKIAQRVFEGVTTDYTYDAKGNVLTRSIDDRTTAYTYNAMGQVIRVDGPRTDVQDITTMDYNAQGLLAKVANALGHEVTFTDYNPWGKPQSMMDANGIASTLAYDGRGRFMQLTTHSRDGDAITVLELDEIGLVKKITRPDGTFIINHYDDARRLTAIEDARGNRINYTLDNDGNRSKETINDASGLLVEVRFQIFDDLSRLIHAVDADNDTDTMGYSPMSNETSMSDGNNNGETNSFDHLHRLVKSYDAFNNPSEFAYDKRDNLTRVTDERSLITRYEYNVFDEVIKITSPDTGVMRYSYDQAGNVASSTDSRGQVTHYTYDAINRVKQISYAGDTGLSISLSYDQAMTELSEQPIPVGNNAYNAGIGRLTQMTDASGITQMRYDDRGNVHFRLEQRAGGSNLITTMKYDLANKMTGMTYPSGISTSYSFEARGLIKGITANYTDVNGTAQNQVIANNIDYRAFGGITTMSYGNGLLFERAYSNDGNLDFYQLKDGSSLTQHIKIMYDSADNMLGLQDLVNSQNSTGYTYDNLDRLTEKWLGINTTDFAYDAVGNRTEKKETVTQTDSPATEMTETYIYGDSNNRLIALDGNNYQYDNAGNLLARVDAEQGAQSWFYDAHNRMTQYRKAGALQASYTYNAMGERVTKTLGNNATQYSYNAQGQLIAEQTSTTAGTLTERLSYVWLYTMPVAVIKQIKAAGATNFTTEIHYIHFDHLNTPRLATAQDKSISWTWNNADAFGDNQPVETGLTLNLRFAGQYYDQESGLHYNYFRDYDSGLGRYVQSDPIGLLYDFNDPQMQVAMQTGIPLDQGGPRRLGEINHLYAYVNNKPVMFYDLYGLVGGQMGRHGKRELSCENKCKHKYIGDWIIGLGIGAGYTAVGGSAGLAYAVGSLGALFNTAGFASCMKDCEDDDDECKK